MYTEFEIKAALDDDSFRRLTKLYNFGVGVRIVDEYYDDSHHVLYEHGVFVRVRDGERLDIKYNPDATDDSHTTCVERSYPLPLRENDCDDVNRLVREFAPAASIVGGDGLPEGEPFLVVTKVRRSYIGRDVSIFIDTVDDLGRFVEVEANRSRAHPLPAVEWARQNRLENLPVGYVELLLRKRDFELYRRGRYQLPTDRS